jgi:hypothetical protein
VFPAAARRPFPSILDDISDELLDLNSALTAGPSTNPETTSVMTEKLNTNAYPILDICTIEIPEGETLPETMPILSFEMMARLSTRRLENNAVAAGDSNSSQGDATSTSENDVFTIDAFPKLHNVHIRHRIPHPALATTTVSVETVTESTTATSMLSSTTTSEFIPIDLGDDDTLEVLEEIDYMSNTRPSSDVESIETNDVTRATPATTATTRRDAFRPFHHVRHHRERLGVVPVPEFKPIRKRVVMSRRNLMETLQEMITKQEQNLERERSLISDELAED